jgi:hypothetical protein
MTSNVARMAVNAAIEKLITQTDEDGESARTVIQYGSKLKKSGRVQLEYSSNTKSSGEEVSGYSPGQGEITIKDKERDEQKEWAFGVNKDRIGYFRLWKEEEGLLQFHHFWKSSITTKPIDDEGPDEYHLGYDSHSLEPKYLGIKRKRIVLTLWFGITLEISRFYLEQVYGTVPKILGIGINFHN